MASVKKDEKQISVKFHLHYKKDDLKVFIGGLAILIGLSFLKNHFISTLAFFFEWIFLMIVIGMLGSYKKEKAKA